MTMHDPHSGMQSGQEGAAWLYDQVNQLKAQTGRFQQQGDQTQAAVLDLNEKLRDAEARIREVSAKTMGLPTMQEQLRQLSGLLDRIQDAEVLIDTKFELLERTAGEERTRDQGEKNDLFRRVQDLERRGENIAERQSSVDDAHRRFQEEVSRSHLQYQGLSGRIEAVEGRTGRNIEAITRLEQEHAELESAVRALRREDDVLAERARLAHEVAQRIEADLQAQAEEYRVLPLIQERVELLRAERQRLEDRTSRLEETLTEGITRLERQEEVTSQVDARMKANDSRIDHVHSATLEFRRSMSDQLLKLNQMLERMKRRRVEELERDIKDLRVQSNHLKNEENEF
jgi:chromosome segregation ATPase